MTVKITKGLVKVDKTELTQEPSKLNETKTTLATINNAMVDYNNEHYSQL